MIRFEQFELDDIRAAMEEMEYRESLYRYDGTDLPFRWFLEKVVEIVDKNRARRLRNSLTTSQTGRTLSRVE